MSNSVVVVDDFLVDTSVGAAIRQVVYHPPGVWGANGRCGSCGVDNDAAMHLLRNTASNGTWTVAGWDRSQPRLSATLDFQGTSATVYCIFFRRALDPVRSNGSANLTFFVNGIMRSSTAIEPENYSFNSNNFTPRMQTFQILNLDPSLFHSLRMEWTHRAVNRTAVAVALDSIELTTASTSTVETNSTERPNNTTKIVVGVLVPLVVLLAFAVAFLLWKRRRRQQEPEQIYQVEPFAPQTQNTSITSPISSTAGAQPPSYYETLASSGSGYELVPTRLSAPISKHRT